MPYTYCIVQHSLNLDVVMLCCSRDYYECHEPNNVSCVAGQGATKPDMEKLKKIGDDLHKCVESKLPA